MSQENVEVIRTIYERWNRNDLGSDLFNPEVEIRQMASLLDTAESGVQHVSRASLVLVIGER
jgi:hypothetical protein